MGLRDLSGKRFGRLCVRRRAENRGKRVHWECACDCGGHAVVASHALTGAKTLSCGCLQAHVAAAHCQSMTTHGHSKGRASPEMRAWRSMIARCENTKHSNYHRYGGAGISVCRRWREDFEAFLQDMGIKPSSKHSIDRIDPAEGYGPENCRWATPVEQQNNKRNNVMIAFHGQTLTMANWARETGIPYRTLKDRIRRGWAASRALTEPIHIEKITRGQEGCRHLEPVK